MIDSLRRLLPVLVVLTLASATVGQSIMPAGISDAFRPDFRRRDMTIAAESLALDDVQAEIVQSLFQDYEDEFRERSGGVREALVGLRPGPTADDVEREHRIQQIRNQVDDLKREYDEAVAALPEGADRSAIHQRFQERAEAMREASGVPRARDANPDDTARLREAFQEVIDAWTIEKADIRAEFVANFHAILSPEQVEAWPVFERRLRRLNALPRGRLVGESVDLHILVRQTSVPEPVRRDVDHMLGAYAVALDEVLVRRDEFLKDLDRQLGALLAAGDVSQLSGLIDEEFRLRAAVRGTNLDGVDRLVEILGSGGEAFRQQFLQRTHARLFSRTPIQRMLAAADELEGLQDDRRESLAILGQNYADALDAVNRSLMDAVWTHEPSVLAYRKKQRHALHDEAAPPWRVDPIRQAFSDRNRLDQAFAQQLQLVLSAAQFVALPGAGRFADVESDDDAAARARLQREMFELFDRDGDGTLSPSEREAMRDYWRGG